MTDDDSGPPVPTVTLSLSHLSIGEDGGVSTVTAELDRTAAETVTLTVSATPGSGTSDRDFMLSGSTLTIAAGSTASTGTVMVTATATGGEAANPASRTLTITNDDSRLEVTPGEVVSGLRINGQDVTVIADENIPDNIEVELRGLDKAVTLRLSAAGAVSTESAAFGLGEEAAARTLVDITVSPVPAGGVDICLPHSATTTATGSPAYRALVVARTGWLGSGMGCGHHGRGAAPGELYKYEFEAPDADAEGSDAGS